MSILGTRVLRTEDPKLLTSGGDYIGDMVVADALHVVYVRSAMAHARIVSVDVTEALALPGVVAVVTASDIELPAEVPMFLLNQAMVRPLIASDTVRYVGEVVAAVVAESHAIAADAAELVVVDYEPLEPVVDPRRAKTDEVLLHPAAGTNTTFSIAGTFDDAPFAAAEVKVELDIVNQRVAPVPMQPRSGVAWWEGERLMVWACTQGAHDTRTHLAGLLGLEADQVRVVVPDMGGGFGAMHGTEPEEVLLGFLSRLVSRPVRWTETRTESMITMVHGRAQFQHVTIAGDRTGRVTAYRLEVVQDAGAYPLLGAVLPFMTRTMAPGVYDIAHVEYEAHSVVTNTNPIGAYRGAGRPEATAAIERAMDAFAVEIGMDPAEVRRRNFIGMEQFPFTTKMGANYDVGDYYRSLELALAAADYPKLREEQARRRAAGETKLLGIGLCTYVEITNPVNSGEFGSIELTADGGAIVRSGSSAHGQGHKTAFAMIASSVTGIDMDRIEVRQGDTDDVPRGGGTGGSRSLQVGGSAVNEASIQLVDRARQLAADRLEAAVDDIELSGGRFHVVGSPAVSVGWAEIAEAESVRIDVDFASPGSTFPFGAHVSVVEVDIETGQVTVLRHVACDDAGTILNPLIVDGQVHGGLAQGIAQALLEEVRFDDDGNPVTSNLADYAAISAAELPMFERVPMETPTPLNPLGAKGIGESGTIGSTPAVHNAVIDALSHLGVRHIDMPTTPEKVWRAVLDR